MKANMTDAAFFTKVESLSLADIAELVGANLPDGADGSLLIDTVAPIEGAGKGQITFLDNPKYVATLESTEASAVLCAKRYVDKVPNGVIALEVKNPYDAFSRVSAAFYPEALKPLPYFEATGNISQAANIHPSAKIEDGVVVEPGATIGAGAEVGKGLCCWCQCGDWSGCSCWT